MTSIELRSTADRALLNAAFKMGVELGRKFEATDVTSDRTGTLARAAREYAAQYIGTFEYMVEMREQLARNPMLSAGQAKGVLNCLMASARRRLADKVAAEAPTVAPLAAAPSGGILNVAAVRDGRYTVVLDPAREPRGISVRLSDPKWEDDPKARKVSVKIGSDEWLGVGKVLEGGAVRFWGKGADYAPRVRAALEVLANTTADEQAVYGKAYAMAGSECWVCGKALDTPESLTAGYGPVCAVKYGLPWGAVAVPAAALAAAASEAKAAVVVARPMSPKEHEDRRPARTTMTPERAAELVAPAPTLGEALPDPRKGGIGPAIGHPERESWLRQALGLDED